MTSPSLYRPVSVVSGEALEELQVRQEYPELTGVRTGLAAWDDHLGETMLPGSLVVIAGGSGKGKTIMMTQLAVAFAHQVPTLALSLEDCARDVVKRAIASMSNEDISNIRGGFHEEGAIPDTVPDAVQRLNDLQLHYIDDTVLSLEGIVSQVEAWATETGAYGRGVLMVDQLSHITASSSTHFFKANGYEQHPGLRADSNQLLEWTAGVLKQIAERYKLIIILAHQLNENHAPGSEPTERSIRGSRGIVHRADCVVIPWVPETVPNPAAGIAGPATIPNKNNDGKLICIKARRSPSFKARIFLVPDRQRFADVDTSSAPVPWAAPASLSSRAIDARNAFVAQSIDFAKRRHTNGAAAAARLHGTAGLAS